MGIVVHIDHKGVLDFPIKGAKFLIEDNIGDRFPIHVHLGETQGIYDNGKGSSSNVFNHGLPNMRFHFTYDDFKELIDNMKKTGKL